VCVVICIYMYINTYMYVCVCACIHAVFLFKALTFEKVRVCSYIYIYIYLCMFRGNNASSFVIPSFGVAKEKTNVHGVATVSRIDRITGFFCRISSLLQGSFAKETYNIIDPTNQSHPIVDNFDKCLQICLQICT